MQVSFVIPLHNCLALTRECLRTLRATLPAGTTAEVVFVDDASTDGTRDWLAGLPAAADAALPVRVVLNDANLGFAATCNRGAAAARGEFLAFLNNDLEFLPGWLPPLLRLAGRSDAGLVGNVQLRLATGAVDHAGIGFDYKGKPYHLTRSAPWHWLTGHRRVAAVTGACFAIRRATWERLGGFDEGFVNGGEDIDLCLRAEAAGLRNRVALRSRVLHHVSASPGRKRRDEENSRRLALRWRPRLAELAATAAARTAFTSSWEEDPRDCADTLLFWGAAAAALRLFDPASPRVVALALASIDHQLAFWHHQFDGGPLPLREPTPRLHEPCTDRPDVL